MEYKQKQSREQSYDVVNYSNGIGRRKVGSKFEYFYIKNNQLVSNKDQERINKLIIPPAWTNVWISNDPNTSIQATGIDSKGRKQYKYNQAHIEESEKKKFLKLIDFIKALPRLEQNMKTHKSLHIYDIKRVIVTILEIIKLYHLRVGKEVYAQYNKSYGVTSLEKKHLKIDKNVAKLNFKAKSNKRVSYTINETDIVTHLKMLMKLEGDKLFQYIDENEYIKKVYDFDLNAYIQQYMGEQFTAKDFRTYAANWYFVNALLTETNKRIPKNNKIIKKNIVNSLNNTAFYLRHTKAISKKSYVMNFVVELYQNNPNYFIEHKNEETDKVLYNLLNMYKKKIISIDYNPSK